MRRLMLVLVCVLSCAVFVPVAQAHDRTPEWGKLNRNASVALTWSGKTWGVSPSWLKSCAESEGTLGHRKPIRGWRMQRSTGGQWFATGSASPRIGGPEIGPMQFLRGTFRSYAPMAWAEARKTGKPRPPKRLYMKRNSALGQAFVAAFMFSKGWSHHWYGRGC